MFNVFGLKEKMKKHLGYLLLKAVRDENEAIVARLIKMGATLEETNKKDVNRWTPLSWAIYRGNVSITKQLINAGADVNAKDKLWGHPLSYRAIMHGRIEILKELIKAGADVNAKDPCGYSLLFVAMRESDSESARFLIQEGADMMIHPKEKWTALHEAAKEGKEDLIQDLIARQADVNAKDIDGQTPFFVAVDFDKTGTAKKLFEMNADVLIKNNKGEDAFQVAMKNRNLELVELIQKQMDLKAKALGYTPLHVAAENGDVGLVKQLIEKGVDVMMQNNKGEDAYHLAMKKGHIKIAKLIKEAVKKQLKAKKIISHQANNQAFLMAQKNGQGHIK